MTFDSQFFVSLLQIIWIDLLLSGDNAVVIALACRSLPERQRKLGIILGAGAAVGLRILFALIITYLLGLPFLKVVGALLLFWIAIKLLVGEEEGGHDNIESADSLWKAVKTIAIADAVMSLDNVVAIAGASRGHPELFIFGLLLSIPLIIMGSQIIMNLISRYPLLIWAGAALLGWIAAEMLLTDVVVLKWLAANLPGWVVSVPVTQDPSGLGLAAAPHYISAVLGAALVIAAGFFMQRKRTVEA